MINEVRSFERDLFYDAMNEHYARQALKAQVTFGPHGEELIQLALIGGDGKVVKEFSPAEALQEIKNALYPDEDLRIVSMYKSRETMFGGEKVHVAVQPS